MAFATPNPSSLVGLGADVVPSSYPYTIHTTGFYPNPTTTFLWNDGSTADSLVAYAPGIYSVTVTYADGCVISNESFTVIQLPIELTHFNAKENNDVVDITWTTASEINNDYFVIERSQNAIDWRQIEKVKGAGNSVSELNYKTVDYSPLKGRSYYRLVQYDFNGNSSTSMPKTVLFEGNSSKTFVVYPNPTSENNINVKLTDFSNKNIELTITDTKGRIFFSKNIFVESNEENVNMNVENKLAKGVYILNIYSNNKIYQEKIIIE